MLSEGEMDNFQQQLSSNSRVEQAKLDHEVYNFLTENSYLIHNDNGYLSLDELIDDNADMFKHNFELTVRKSLALIYYSDDSKRLSSSKKRLKEHLLGIFHGAKSLITDLTTDHHLLLRIYTKFFK